MVLITQDTTWYHKVSLLALGGKRLTNGILSEGEKSRLGGLNRGTSAGYTQVFPREAVLPTGETIVFDVSTPADRDGKGVLRIGKDGGRTITLASAKNDDLSCIQFNGDFSRMLMSWQSQGRVDVYDFVALLKDGDREKALLGTIREDNLARAVFFIGKTDEVMTAHWNNRVLRWRHAPSGYESEQVYLGDSPIFYAEPDVDGSRILIAENYGQGMVGAYLYSVRARRKWLDLVDNYKWIGMAFATNGDIVYGASNWPEKNSTVYHFSRLQDLARVAQIVLADDCRVADGESLGKSLCWPAGLDADATVRGASSRDPQLSEGVTSLLLDLGRALVDATQQFLE